MTCFCDSLIWGLRILLFIILFIFQWNIIFPILILILLIFKLIFFIFDWAKKPHRWYGESNSKRPAKAPNAFKLRESLTPVYDCRHMTAPYMIIVYDCAVYDYRIWVSAYDVSVYDCRHMTAPYMINVYDCTVYDYRIWVSVYDVSVYDCRHMTAPYMITAYD